jgi:hypothetical protein
VAERDARTVMMKWTPLHRLFVWVPLSSPSQGKASSASFQCSRRVRRWESLVTVSERDWPVAPGTAAERPAPAKVIPRLRGSKDSYRKLPNFLPNLPNFSA